MSLVSPKSLELAFSVHYVDSLAISDFAHTIWQSEGVVHDLGTGSGFPGIVFAIRFPTVPIFLYEKTQKKRTFLTAALDELKLPNAQLRGPFPERGVSGLILGRAVMPREKLFPFIANCSLPGTRLITNLGGNPDIPAAPENFRKLKETRYTLPLDCGDRQAEAYVFLGRGRQSR